MKKPLILIADDEIRLRKLVSDFLLNSSYGVLTAADGKQAYDIFMEDRHKIDLIILDVMMPQMDGWEVLKEIKKYHRFLLSCLRQNQKKRINFKGLNLVQTIMLPNPSPQVF